MIIHVCNANSLQEITQQTVLLEKTLGHQLVKKFPALYANRNFINLFFRISYDWSQY